MGKKFQKEFEKLKKKYRSLEEDFEILKKVILTVPFGNGTKHWNTLKKDDEKCIMKIRMMCRSLKGADFRVIYYYDREVLELEFIEISFKGNKENEDRERVERIWSERGV